MTENPIKDAASGGYGVGGNNNGDNAGADDPLASFRYAMKSKDTEKQSFIRLRYFFNGIGIEGNDVATQASNFLAQAATKNRKYTDACIFNFSRYLKDRYDKKELKGGTVRNYLFAVKLFYEVNDIEYDWRKIKRGLPVANYIAHDRAPTLEEIRKLIAYPDRRIKVIVLIMTSSGIRVGAFDYLKLKHVIPIKNEKDEIIAAKLIVYAGEPEEHFTFITPEAYQSIQEYMDFRKLHYEEITKESWVLRDKFPTASEKHAANKSIATNPQKLDSEAIKKLLQRAWRVQGLRHVLNKNEHRHEVKTTHGLRKYFMTNAERVMLSVNVAKLADHKIDLRDNYVRFSEQELLEDYLKAVDYLTIHKDTKITTQMQKQIAQLTEKSEQENYAILGKLTEKEKETEDLRKQIEQIKKDQSKMQEVMDRGMAYMINYDMQGITYEQVLEQLASQFEEAVKESEEREITGRKLKIKEGFAPVDFKTETLKEFISTVKERQRVKQKA